MKQIVKFLTIILFAFTIFYLFIDSVFAATTATINDTDGVFIRSGPGTNNSTVALLSYGKQITLINTTKHDGAGCDGWYQVNYDGRTDRYICSELITLNASSSINTNGYYTTSNWGTRINENYAIVRNSPGGSAIENIYLGTPITIIEKSYATSSCSEGWTKISYYGGKIGYVCDFLISSYENLTSTNTEYVKELEKAGFPKSYWPFLNKLHQLHPSWSFVPDNTNKDFSTVVMAETGKNYIQTTQNSYITNPIPVESGTYYIASSAVVAFMLDPRNYLTERNIFAFEGLSYNSKLHTSDIVKNIFKGSYLDNETYINAFMKAATDYNISPVHLATRVKQEGGTNATYSAISGTATSVSGLKFYDSNLDGFYNYYNIGAWEENDNTAVARGLATAGCLVDCDYYKANYNTPWDTKEKAILYGAKYLADGYINNGQDTMYYQKFNVSDDAYFASYTHQYMTNIIAPFSESLSTYHSFRSLNLLDTAYTFYIPIYNNLPEQFTSHPIIGDNNNNLASLEINDMSVEGFDKDILEYVEYVTSDVKEVNIKATPATSVSTVTGDGKITLNTDNYTTTISINVTAQTGVTKVYVINIIKVDTSNQTITDLVDLIDVKINDSNKEHLLMSNIEENTAASLLIREFIKNNPKAEVTITNKDNSIKTNEILATGDILKIKLDNEEKTYTIAIKGDINGDGKITIIDLLRVQKHILKYATYENEFAYACDTNYDNQVTIIDLLRIQKHILKYITLK